MEDLNLSQLTKELNIWIELGTNDDTCTDDMASNIQQNTFNQIAADMCTNDPIAPSQTVSLGIDKSINESLGIDKSINESLGIDKSIKKS